MPYEYRKLSPEERKRVVEERKRRGFPLHQPPHPFREKGAYLITAANFEHVPVMSSAGRRTEFQEKILEELQGANVEISGWVILPNHYHILVYAETLNSISAVLKQVHGSTSRRWNEEDGLSGKRKVWYHFSDQVIRNEMHFNRALNYIHYNPVKHGYAGDIYGWEWSSLFTYLDEKGSDWLKENWQKFTPPDDFGGSWDN